MNNVESNYYGEPVHNTHNDSKYFTVVVTTTVYGTWNVSIIYDRSAMSLITVLYTLSWTQSKVNCTVRSPQVYIHVNMEICNFWISFKANASRSPYWFHIINHKLITGAMNNTFRKQIQGKNTACRMKQRRYPLLGRITGRKLNKITTTY
jgi:hypothetical protein